MFRAIIFIFSILNSTLALAQNDKASYAMCENLLKNPSFISSGDFYSSFAKSAEKNKIYFDKNTDHNIREISALKQKRGDLYFSKDLKDSDPQIVEINSKIKKLTKTVNQVVCKDYTPHCAGAVLEKDIYGITEKYGISHYGKQTSKAERDNNKFSFFFELIKSCRNICTKSRNELNDLIAHYGYPQRNCKGCKWDSKDIFNSLKKVKAECSNSKDVPQTKTSESSRSKIQK
jgi:hypothetical protein